MTAKFNVIGAERKRLADTIADFLGCIKEYLGAPSFAYQVDFITVSKDGAITFDDMSDTKIIEELFEVLAGAGFIAEDAEPAEETEESATETAETADGLTLEMPRDYFTGAALENLRRLVEAKGTLIKKALGADSLPIEITEDKVVFPWFTETDADSVKAYTHFITALCDMAKNQKRITSTEKSVDNEKFAFRCLLLRLVFIGEAYKAERKILLKNLTGSSAFKSGKPTETVKTICYGKEEVWSSRRKAEKFFLEAMNGSEGCEHDRYAAIYEQLKAGQTVCSDSV